MTRLAAASGKTEHAITYLSGAVVPEALGQRDDFGVLLTYLMGNVPRPLGTHAHDNGVYSEWKSGVPFDLGRFLNHLDMFHGMAHRCLFAAAPDVIGDWQATLRRSAPVLPLIRAKGYRAALVAQDGLEDHVDSIPWEDFDVLFLGGGQDKKYLSPTNRVRVKRADGSHEWVGEWKLTNGAARLTRMARAFGMDVHMGRVNSYKRLAYAQSIGCTSADGTKIAYGPDTHTPTVQGWVRTANGYVLHNVASCYVCRWKCEAYARGNRIPIQEFLRTKQLELEANPELLAGHTPRLPAYATYREAMRARGEARNDVFAQDHTVPFRQLELAA